MAADRYLSTAELVEEFPDFFSKGTLAYWRHLARTTGVQKGPRGFKPGKEVRYDREDVLAWIETKKAEAI